MSMNCSNWWKWRFRLGINGSSWLFYWQLFRIFRLHVLIWKTIFSVSYLETSEDWLIWVWTVCKKLNSSQGILSYTFKMVCDPYQYLSWFINQIFHRFARVWDTFVYKWRYKHSKWWQWYGHCSSCGWSQPNRAFRNKPRLWNYFTKCQPTWKHWSHSKQVSCYLGLEECTSRVGYYLYWAMMGIVLRLTFWNTWRV